MTFTLRPAAAADQPAINRIVRQAGINPMNLNWTRFIVAEAVYDPVEAGLRTASNLSLTQPDPPRQEIIIGVGQIKSHRDGSRELASIAVVPEWRGQGVASAIIRCLLEGESGELYLFCRDRLEAFYEPFGFRRAAPPPASRTGVPEPGSHKTPHSTRSAPTGSPLPKSLARLHRAANLMAAIGSRLSGETITIIVMKREG